MSRRIKYAAITRQGQRKNNQDNMCCSDFYLPEAHEDTEKTITGEVGRKVPVLAVFDGMGGESKGETASFLAAKRCAGSSFERSVISRFLDRGIKEDVERLCKDMNRDVVDFADKNRIHTMGSTVAGLYFGSRKLLAFNIGDSRVYSVKNGNLTQLSKDHVESESIFMNPGLTQFLGIDPEEMIIEPEIQELAYEKDEIYFICSDGVSHFLTDKRMLDIVKESSTLEEIAQQLIQAADDSGSNDNMTVIVCKAE